MFTRNFAMLCQRRTALWLVWSTNGTEWTWRQKTTNGSIGPPFLPLGSVHPQNTLLQWELPARMPWRRNLNATPARMTRKVWWIQMAKYCFRKIHPCSWRVKRKLHEFCMFMAQFCGRAIFDSCFLNLHISETCRPTASQPRVATSARTIFEEITQNEPRWRKPARCWSSDCKSSARYAY